MSDSIKKTKIAGLLVIERPTFTDERGFFHEVFRLNELKELGVDFHPVQLSHALSKPGVIRAIHTEGWNKIVYPVSGKLFVAVRIASLKRKNESKNTPTLGTASRLFVSRNKLRVSLTSEKSCFSRFCS